MSLKHSYTLIAPFYDAVVAAATRRARERSLRALPAESSRILIAGVGTGLDLPLLPRQHHYVGVDLTPAMLQRALPRAGGVDFTPLRGDVQRLPFADAAFDAVVLHLIVCVVPHPASCLAEAARVVRPGGRVLIFDKFVRPGDPAPLRRLANPVVRRVATGLTVVWEDLLAHVPEFSQTRNQPSLGGGWFREIVLTRN